MPSTSTYEPVPTAADNPAHEPSFKSRLKSRLPPLRTTFLVALAFGFVTLATYQSEQWSVAKHLGLSTDSQQEPLAPPESSLESVPSPSGAPETPSQNTTMSGQGKYSVG